MPKQDYYERLGVSKTASKDEIKKAFHKLAMKHHPDKNKGDDTEFKKINEAYQTLSDDSKRAQYDQFGHAGANMGGGYGGGQQGGFGGFDFSGFQNGNVEFDMGDIGDIFGEFFGGDGGRRTQARRGSDIQTEMHISFEEAVFGIKRTVSLEKKSVCDTCDGNGAKKGTTQKTCTTCNGRGKIIETKRSILGSFQSERACDTCYGTGKIPEEKCGECKGAGIVRKHERIDVSIPAGIEHGQVVRLQGMGEAMPRGTAGDLYIRITVAPHKVWRREGLNLTSDLEIKMSEALLGSTRNIETLDGVVDIKIPEGITHGEILRIKGKGVPDGRSHRGDIMLRVKIKFPAKLSKKARTLIEELREEGL